MILTKTERTRFYEEATGKMSRQASFGYLRGVDPNGFSKCCEEKIDFTNLKLEETTRGNVIISEVQCPRCRSFLGDSVVNVNNIKENRNGIRIKR